MKRAKIALTAIAVFAVVGGTLAFGSYRNITTFYRPTAAGTGACTLTANNTIPVNTTTGTVYATTVPGAPCSIKGTLSARP